MSFTRAVIVGAIALAACRSEDSHVEKDLRATYPESFATTEPYTVYDMQTRAHIPVGVQRTASGAYDEDWRSTRPESFDTSSTYAPGTPETIGAQSFTTSERDFLVCAASAGRFEVESSHIALQKGVTGELRAFAERMISEHEEVNREVERIAQKRRVSLPLELDAKHETQLEELRRLDGQEFRQRYYDLQVAGHEKMVDKLEAAVRDCDNMEVRAIAQRALDSARQHLQHLKDIPEPR